VNWDSAFEENKMPTIFNEQREGHMRTTVHIQPGERVKLCRCMQSKEMPYCDGTHKTLPDTNAGPVIVEVFPLAEKRDQARPSA
jgi:CDGSH-type Zn-finger protein